MSDWVKVAHTTDIPLGTTIRHEFDADSVLICHVEGEFYAVSGICTHQQVDLDGALDGCELECPLHGARFDARTGDVKNLPASQPLKRYPLKIEDGDIYVESPDDDWW